MEIGAAGGVLRMSPLPYCQAKDCQDGRLCCIRGKKGFRSSPVPADI